jgi:protein phosphatase
MPEKIEYLHQQGKRKNIEDSLFPIPGTARNTDRVFIVCDGVGGEQKGEVASQIVCSYMGSVLSAAKPDTITEVSIQQAASDAVAAMQDYAKLHPDAQNMSTTLTLCYFQNGGVWVAWCGDSRVYHLRNGNVLWKTKDHSLVQQLVDAGEITEEEALTHPRKNIILRSLSAASDKATVDTHYISDLQEGDHLLLCTDGLLEQIQDEHLYQILNQNNRQKDKSILFQNYCEGKTNDNYSMYLLQVGSVSKSRTSSGYKKLFWFLAASIILLASLIVFTKRNSTEKPTDLHKEPENSPASIRQTKPNQSEIPLPSVNKKPK